MSKKFTFSIIIPTIGRPASLKRCLQSIIIQTVLPQEVILVDVSDTDESKTIAQKLFQETAIHFIHITPKIKGSAYQRNLGAQQATGEILLFLDDDVELEKEYLEVLTGLYEKNRDCVGAGGYITNAHKNTLPGLLFRKLFMLSHNGGKSRLQVSGYPGWDFQPQHEQEVDILSGCNLSVRRDVFGNYGFCEAFGGYSLMEDVELSYQIAKKHRLLQTPLARLAHYESQMARKKIELFYFQQVKHHYYIYHHHLPQNLHTKCAYYWSEFGVLILAKLYCLKYRNFDALRGFVRGFREREQMREKNV